ncbi:MAG: ABC transporter permease, partial [Bacteroidota bacterium]
RFENNTLYFSGAFLLENSGFVSKNIWKEIKKTEVDSVIINLERLENIDSAGVITLHQLQDNLRSEGITIRIEGASGEIDEKIKLFSKQPSQKHDDSSQPGWVENLGGAVIDFFSDYLYGFLTLAADVFYWSFLGIFNKKSARKGEFVNQSILIGANALLIVVFMSFIIGLVMALQSSQQLSNFGANIYIVDLTVIAIMSQMGPLITAVLVAGRSGSAIAAEIATMKVTSELDALQTMGLNPIRFVVVPKMYAGLFTMPFLIILANVAGIAGGAVAGYFYLDITFEVFINRMDQVMSNKDLLTGFVKSQVYAALIVITGSFYGFRVVRGAEGVGKVTTTAVVVSISLVIVADSILGLLFY